MARPVTPIILSESQSEIIARFSQSRSLSHHLVQRAALIQLAAAGHSNKAIGQSLGLCEETVGLWRRRWLAGAEQFVPHEANLKRLETAMIDVLSDQPRSGAPTTFTAEQVCRIIALACSKPPDPLSHWTHAELARVAIEKDIVDTISTTSIERFLKSGRPTASPHSLLAQSRDRG